MITFIMRKKRNRMGKKIQKTRMIMMKMKGKLCAII